MEAFRPQIILACVAAYFVLCIGIGLWAMRRTKSARDFFMAGRDLGVLVTAIAIFSSTMSGFGFVGGPGFVYQMGTSSFWIVISSVFGNAVCIYLLGTKLRIMAEEHDSISLPDVVATRYNSSAAGLLTAIAILLGVIGYLAAQILAMATVLQTLLKTVDWIGLVPIEMCAAAATALLVFYCVTGGIVASVYTDLVQGFIMMVAAVLVFLAAVKSVDGGFTAMSQTMMLDDPASIGPWGTKGMLGSLSWYFVFAVGVCGQPHLVTKLMMTRRVRDVRATLPLAIIGFAITALLWVGLGMAMRTLVLQGKFPELASANEAAPEFLQNYTSPLLAGVVFAGLFAAIMSTSDAFLSIGAAAIVHDIPRAALGRTPRNELLWARIATALLAIGATLFSLYSGPRLIALLGAFGWGTFSAALVPAVAIGFNWKRANATAACAAISASLVVNFGIKLADTLGGGHTLPYSLDTGAVALLVSLILFFGISLASKPVSAKGTVRQDALQN